MTFGSALSSAPRENELASLKGTNSAYVAHHNPPRANSVVKSERQQRNETRSAALVPLPCIHSTCADEGCSRENMLLLCSAQSITKNSAT